MNEHPEHEIEKQLILSLQKRISDEEFQQLIIPYLQYGFSIIYGVLQDKENTEDALQEALIKVLNNIKQFRFKSSFKTWFSRICYNEALQFVRRNQKRSKDVHSEILLDTAPDDQDLEDRVIKKIEVEELQEQMRKLNENYRSVLLMHYKQELSLKEIAGITNKKENQVKVTLHRARNSLKKLIQSETKIS